MTDDQIPPRAGFIVGVARSGTSMLVSLLDGHPEVCALPYETKVFDWCMEPDSLHAFFDKTEFREIFPSDSPERETLEASLRASLRGPTEYGRALEAIVAAFEEIKPTPGAKIWIEKTPKHLRSLPLLLGRFGPQTRAVIVVRDPRATYSSQKKRWNRQGLKAARRFARRWATADVLTRRFAKQFEKEVLVVRYEDLVRQTGTWMPRVTDHFGIGDDASLKTMTKFGEPWGGNSSFGVRVNSVATHALDRWVDHLDKEEIVVIEELLAPYMSRHGYELTVASPASVFSWHRRRMEVSSRINVMAERRRWRQRARLD
jgi:hypothetical protein